MKFPVTAPKINFRFAPYCSAITICLASHLQADGVNIDKVYNPYVEQTEKEIGLRSSFYEYDGDKKDIAAHNLSLGYSFAESWLAEINFIATKEDDDSLTLQAYELEAKWQLSEQGEYAVDWGLVFEFEDLRKTEGYEIGATLVTAFEFGQWATNTNLSFIYEYKEHISNEFETAFSAQTRYRLKKEFEAGFELYVGQDTFALGPVIMGTLNMSGRKKTYWEVGTIFGLDSDDDTLTPDLTIRALFEFEF